MPKNILAGDMRDVISYVVADDRHACCKALYKGRMIRTAVNNVVTLRPRFGKAVLGGYRGECVHASRAYT